MTTKIYCIMRKFLLLFLLTASLTMQAANPLPAPFRATVLRIWDGDTFDCTDGRERYRIRINGIDAPEMNQPNGPISRKILTSIIGSHKVEVIPIDYDTYGRILATVLTDEGNDISEILLTYGYAWHYVLYDSNPKYRAAEQKARDNHNGIWSQTTQPVQPWLWRAGIKKPIY